MFAALLVVLATFCILLVAEYLSRAKALHAELTRKFVHIAVGAFVAFWPFFISWGMIQLLSLAFLAVILLSIKLHIFRSIHGVDRDALGEVLFAVIIGVLAVITTEPWVFAAAMLHLSVADGLAAVAGVRWGRSTMYKVLGQTKSVVGTVTCVAVSAAIIALYALLSDHTVAPAVFVLLPLAVGAAENLAVKGTDNVVVPLLVAVVLLASL